MVAITVILAAVIGAFVLEIGDQQETAPSTSFDSEEGNYRVHTGANAHDNSRFYMDLTRVDLTIAGGESLAISSIRLSHEGNTSIWARPNGEAKYGPQNAGTPGDRQQLTPQPDVCETVGDNDQVEWTAGETNRILYSGGTNFRTLDSGSYPGSGHPFPNLNNVPQITYGCTYWFMNIDNDHMNMYPGDGSNSGDNYLAAKFLESGDQVSVVWSAASGGKTQTLFKYEVQSSSEL